MCTGSDDSKSAIAATVKRPPFSQAECDGGYEQLTAKIASFRRPQSVAFTDLYVKL